MFDDPEGPIEHFSWGTFIVCGGKHSKTGGKKKGKGKDIRLIGRKVRRWKEREGHRLKPSMISCVFDREVEVLVIGSGVDGCIECPKVVMESARRHGIKRVIVLRTPQACRTYNELFHKGRKVALLAHGTC